MQEKQWLIKHSTGQIDGPFEAEDICTQINNLQLTGEELISEYPYGSWKSISSYPQFYDAFLSALNTQQSQHKSYQSSFRKVDLKTNASTTHKDSSNTTSRPSSFRRSLSQSSTSQRPSKGIRIRGKKDLENDPSKYIDMGREYPLLIKNLLKKFIFSMIGIGAIVSGFLLLQKTSSDSKKQTKSDFYLISPRSGQASQSIKEVIDRIKKGMSFYFDGHFSAYKKAKYQWIEAIEGDIKNKTATAYLCLSYYELWPYTHQKPKDIKAVTTAMKKINMMDTGGVYSALCQITYHLIHRQHRKATSLLATAISEASKNKNPENILPFLYYLKGHLLIQQTKYDSALIALESAKALLPQEQMMVGIELAIADTFRKQNQQSKALNIYSSILTKHPQHKLAMLDKGVLFYEHLNKKEEGIQMIQTALQLPEFILPHHLASAYLILAKNALQIENKKEFLEYGKKSYALDPTNKAFQQLLKKANLSETEQKKIKLSTNAQGYSLIQQGDQLETEGLFLEARKYYKQAFKKDKEKNAIAAVKVSKNLWRFGLVHESVYWLKKAISADSSYIPAYILLSDYYSQLYDFNNTQKILKIANQQSHNHIEVFKRYATLLIKKDDAKSAILYAKKALSIYTSDIESYVILSQAYEELDQTNQSFSSISKALEIDPNHQKAQIQYARIRALIYGIKDATHYLTKLIEQSQEMTNNYINYVLALSQLLYDHKQYQESKSILLNLKSLQDKPLKYYILMAQIDSKNLATIEQAYEELITASIHSPSNPKVMFLLSSILVKTKNYKEAKSYIHKLLRSYPYYPDAHYQLASILYQQGGKINLRKAIEELKKEQKLNPTKTHSYQLAGKIYYDLKEYILCARSFQKAIELDSTDSVFYVQVAECYKQSGDIDLALQMLKAVSEQDKPGKIHNPNVYKEMGYLYELKRNYVLAKKSYTKYLHLLPPGSEESKEVKKQISQIEKSL